MLICGWIEFYGFYSSTRFTFHDTWTPTTESPGFDDINFSTRASDIADITESMLSGGETETDGLDKISTISFESIGVSIGGICFGGVFSDLELLDPEDCRGYELFSVFSRTAPETEDIAKRQPNVVYITGHRVGWIGPFHLAVEYSESSTAKTTLSAGPIGGKLVSGINRESDFSGNVTLGTTTSNLGLSSAPYFVQMLSKYGNYSNNLDYELFPQSGTNGYNSNSYVHGLVNSASGGSSVEFNQFVGGSKPVPNNEFN